MGENSDKEAAAAEQWILGRYHKPIALNHRADSLETMDAMLSQAGHTIDLFTRELDPALFNRQPVLDALKQLAIGNQHAAIRIMIRDSNHIIKSGHRLIELSRRLSSYIEIRNPHPDYHDFGESFILVDRIAYIHHPVGSRYEGTANFMDPMRAKELGGFFDEVWERSIADGELRRLHL